MKALLLHQQTSVPFSPITGGDPAELFEEEEEQDQDHRSDSATDPDSDSDQDATADEPGFRHHVSSSTSTIRTQLGRREEDTSLHPIQKYRSAFFKKRDIKDYIKKMDPLSKREKY